MKKKRIYDNMQTNISNVRIQKALRTYVYQQEILDNLEAEREVYGGHYNNLVVAATGAHTIILTSQKDTEIRILRTCLFNLGKNLLRGGGKINKLTYSLQTDTIEA